MVDSVGRDTATDKNQYHNLTFKSLPWAPRVKDNNNSSNVWP